MNLELAVLILEFHLLLKLEFKSNFHKLRFYTYKNKLYLQKLFVHTNEPYLLKDEDVNLEQFGIVFNPKKYRKSLVFINLFLVFK